MINSKLCGWYACERRGEWLPLTEFGVDKSRLDGRNGYCRKCNALRCVAWRKGVKTVRVARKAFQLAQSKPATDVVMEAIKCGAHSRSEIKKATKLDWDSVVDCLADLRFEQNLLQSRVVNGERCFYLAA